MQLSVVIITLNEEKHIQNCISHLEALNAEIIVVDSGSADNTVKIAESLGASVFSHKWRGYAYARNLGAEKASNDWVLSIDADEYMSRVLCMSILRLKQPDRTKVFSLDRLNYFAGTPIRHSGWYPDYVKRLYFRKNAKWEGEYVHESLISKNTSENKLTGKLHHYSYSDKKDHQQKMDKYALLSAQKMHRKGKKYSAVIMYLKSAWRWFRTFILKLGILDGKYGWYLSNKNAEMIRKKFRYLKELKKEEY